MRRGRARRVLLTLSAGGVAAAASLGAATMAGAHRTVTSMTTGCGSGPFFELRTLSDATRHRVNFTPKDTTVATIGGLAAPHPTPTLRTTPFERQVWQVAAQITSFKLDANGTIRLVLFDHGAYMNAELPSLRCLSSESLARNAIIATRRWFVTHCGRPKPSSESLGAVVKISGVGFWAPGASRSVAPNGAELAPVVGIHPLAGCGA